MYQKYNDYFEEYVNISFIYLYKPVLSVALYTILITFSLFLLVDKRTRQYPAEDVVPVLPPTMEYPSGTSDSPVKYKQVFVQT